MDTGEPGVERLVKTLPNCEWKPARDPQAKYGINVPAFLGHFNIRDERIRGAITKYPTLSYLLGSSELPCDLYGSIKEPYVQLLTEGSGMFGLSEYKGEAKKWYGIFKHIMGTARQVFWMADRLSNLTKDQINQFADLGFDISSLKDLNPEILRDFMFLSHAGRRQMDESPLRPGDCAHLSTDSGKNSLDLLTKWGADQRFIDLIRTENIEYQVEAGKSGKFPNIIDNILLYCDWTFGKKAMTLPDRFKRLREKGRTTPEESSILEECGNFFEKALKVIVDPDIFEKMTNAEPYAWETEIRSAYGQYD